MVGDRFQVQLLVKITLAYICLITFVFDFYLQFEKEYTLQNLVISIKFNGTQKLKIRHL